MWRCIHFHIWISYAAILSCFRCVLFSSKIQFQELFLKKCKKAFITVRYLFLVGTKVSLIIPSWRVFNWKELVFAFLSGDLSIIHVGATWFLVCLFEVVILFYPLYHLLIKRMDYPVIVVFTAFLGIGAYYVPFVCNKIGLNIHFDYLDVVTMGLFFI